MRIHLICDQKWRDLPSNVALKLYLERDGFRVSIASLKDSFSLLPVLRPDAVVFNHMFGTSHPELARKIRAAGAKVIVLPTEGAARPELEPVVLGDFSDFSVIDLYLSWSDYVAEQLRQRNTVPADGIKTTGFYRFDFHVPPLNETTESRAAFCSKYRLDPKRSTVTWTTQYNYAHVTRDGPHWEKFQREFIDFGGKDCFAKIDVDFREIPEILRKSRDAAVRAFCEVTPLFPDVQFILKPHPAEDKEFYTSRFSSSNVTVVPNELIWNVLNATDLLLHRQCTTAVEAWTRGLPTIEMAMYRDKAFTWPAIEEGSFAAESASDLAKFIAQGLRDRDVPESMKAIRSAYIAKHYHAADGRRTKAAAEAISEFMRTKHEKSPSFLPLAKSLGGVSRAVKNGIRYWIDVPSGVPLREDLSLRLKGRRSSSPSSKNITRRDVAICEADVRPFLVEG